MYYRRTGWRAFLFSFLLSAHGFVQQEQIALADFMANRFGRYYESQLATRFSRGVGALAEPASKP